MSQKRQPKSGAKKKRSKRRRSGQRGGGGEGPIEASGTLAGLARSFRRVAGVEGAEGDARNAKDRWTGRAMSVFFLLAAAGILWWRFGS